MTYVLMFQELIQNADDAGAETIRFLWDESEYKTRTLFDPDHTKDLQVIITK